jgi:hypothetical protein
MTRRSFGAGLIVIGVVGLVISLLADVIGVGFYPSAIGWVQITGAVIGLLIALVGVRLILKK